MFPRKYDLQTPTARLQGARTSKGSLCPLSSSTLVVGGGCGTNEEERRESDYGHSISLAASGDCTKYRDDLEVGMANWAATQERMVIESAIIRPVVVCNAIQVCESIISSPCFLVRRINIYSYDD